MLSDFSVDLHFLPFPPFRIFPITLSCLYWICLDLVCLGARINYIFNDLFGAYVDGIDALGGLTDEEVQVIMANATVRSP